MAVPGSTCTDPERWDRAVLRSTPTVVALSSELREPGNYTMTKLGDLNVIVVRDEVGQVYVQLNRCTHRGTELVSGRGSKPRFICPFHGWSFQALR